MIHESPPEPGAEHHETEAGKKHRAGVAPTLEGDADEGAAKKPPRRSLDHEAEYRPPERVRLQAETHRLAVGLLPAKADADGRKCGDQAGAPVAIEQEAEDEADHRPGNHGAERSAANRAAQSPAERHGDGAEETPVPEWPR